MEAWPTTVLPSPLLASSARCPSAISRTELESGRARQRRRFTTSPRFFNVSWILTLYELQMFAAFFENKLNQGADQFTMSLSLNHEVSTIYTVRFLDGTYNQEKVSNNHWKVSATLDVENPLTLAAEAYDFIVAGTYDFATLNTLLARIDLFVETDLNLLNT